MHSLILRLTLGLFISAAAISAGGCSAPTSPESQVKVGDVGSTVELKQWLILISESGEGGSAFEGLEASIDKVEVDATVKESLKADLSELLKARTPAKIKEISGRMAGRL